MKIVKFGGDERPARVGLVAGEWIIDVHRADPRIPSDLLEVIEAGPQALDLLRELGDTIGSVRDDARFPAGAMRLFAPWPRKRIAMAGGNFADHVLEAGLKGGVREGQTVEDVYEEIRSEPIWGFWKILDELTNPGDGLVCPERTRHLDYEGEVAVVFGRRCRNVKEKDFLQQVWGVTLMNDWSDRTVKFDGKPMSWNLMKNFDGSATIGPCIVVDELDPQDVDVQTHVNGDLRQDFNSRDMIFSFAEITAALTQDLSFVPGDILAGGTAKGTVVDIVGATKRWEPDGEKQFLQPGDLVTVSSPAIGALTNTVIAGRGADPAKS